MGFVVLMYGVKSRPDVFGTGVTDNVVDGVEDVAAALGQNIQTLGDLCCDFLRGAVGQHILRVYAAAPEYQLVAVLFLEHACVHALGGQLYRIDDIHTHVDKVVEQLDDTAAGVEEGLPVGVLVNPVAHALVIGFVQLLEHVGRHKFCVLRAEVSAADPANLDVIADCLLVDFQILEHELGLHLKDFLYILGIENLCHAPLVKLADALRMLLKGRRDGTWIAKTGASQIADHAVVGLSE